ncbi:UNVERIFIED_CONTAM: hypothetical protein PYX00_007981 [Menopon gallinae]|uniref:Uncharacterized protein n=1 Tax=Menopon gallinae TaxID=328185 RepID=A0AAW2HKZ3_9NEOP
MNVDGEWAIYWSEYWNTVFVRFVQSDEAEVVRVQSPHSLAGHADREISVPEVKVSVENVGIGKWTCKQYWWNGLVPKSKTGEEKRVEFTTGRAATTTSQTEWKWSSASGRVHRGGRAVCGSVVSEGQQSHRKILNRQEEAVLRLSADIGFG